MTAALEGGEWSAARPGRTLPPGKTRHPFYRRLGGGQGRSERAENLVPTGIRSRTVQPVAQLLYRLSYPTHANISTLPIIQVKISDILYQYNEYKLFVKNISFRSYYKHVLVSLCSQVVETCI